MYDKQAIETRLRWLETTITDLLAYGLSDVPLATLKHINGSIKSLCAEERLLKRELANITRLESRPNENVSQQSV